MTKIAVREGRLVVPTCPKCGCRLEKIGENFYHYKGLNWCIKKDARGCSCKLLDMSFIIVNRVVTPLFDPIVE